MQTASTILLALTLTGWGVTVVGQEASTPPAPAPVTSVTKSCTDLKPRAKQECLKVARQMDSDTPTPETTSTSSSVDTVHHSSSVMETPEEKRAAARTAKSSKGASKAPPPPKTAEGQQPPNP